MTCRQFASWISYYLLEPFGPEVPAETAVAHTQTDDQMMDDFAAMFGGGRG